MHDAIDEVSIIIKAFEDQTDERLRKMPKMARDNTYDVRKELNYIDAANQMISWLKARREELESQR